MLEIIETVTMSPRQYKVVIEGMRNPMNSWGKSDSRCVGHYTVSGCDEFVMGDNDLVLMKNLASLPPEHAKYRRMMPGNDKCSFVLVEAVRHLPDRQGEQFMLYNAPYCK